MKILEAALGGGGAGNPMQAGIMQILSHYIHYEV